MKRTSSRENAAFSIFSASFVASFFDFFGSGWGCLEEEEEGGGRRGGEVKTPINQQEKIIQHAACSNCSEGINHMTPARKNEIMKSSRTTQQLVD